MHIIPLEFLITHPKVLLFPILQSSKFKLSLPLPIYTIKENG